MGDADPVRRVVRFGSYEVDLRAGELRKKGFKIKLQEKPFQILAALLEQPGELVTRKELQERLWSADTFVDFDGSLNAAVGKLREALSDSAENPRFVETLPRRGYRFVAPVEKHVSAAPVATDSRTPPRSNAEGEQLPVAQDGVNVSRVGPVFAPHDKSIAVLPFENLSSESEQEYFCDGITEELINALTQVEGLRVVARTSAFAFKRLHRDIRKIGEALNVGLVVEGTVRKAGDRLRITAQLINVLSGYHLWSQQYDRKLKDVFAIQEEIAQAIVKALRIRLVGQLNRSLVNKYTDNLEAYDLYFKGLHRWHKQTKEEMKRACRYFEQAVQTDPNYVPACVGLSDCYRLLGFWGALSPQEVMPKAKTAAVKALEIDDTIGEAHRALAGVKGLYDWDDWPGTEREYLRAIELNPADAITRQSYAIVYLAPMGRLDEAIEQMRVAEEIDPLSPFHCTIVGWALYLAGRYAEAIEQCRKALRLDPNFHLAHLVKGWAYEQKSGFEEALDSFENARSSAGSIPLVLGSLAHCHALGGATKEATKLLDDLKGMSTERYVPPLEIAVIYAGLREKDLALEWLNKAYADRTPRLTLFRVDPRFDSLRTEPQFTVLLNKMGLSTAAHSSRVPV